MDPFYRSDDGAITVFCARWEDVHAAGLVPNDVDLVHADPPYGINLNTKARGKESTFGRGTVPIKRRDYPPIAGDDRPFEPGPLLALDRRLVLWGANHYSARLPSSATWFVWDKREDFGDDNGADCEMAWTNLGGPARMFRHLWKGTCRASEAGPNHPHLHPTQKPIALSKWVFQRAKLKPGAVVFVPFLGSGPDLVAARSMGLRVIACDVERWCCEAAVGRLVSKGPQLALAL